MRAKTTTDYLSWDSSMNLIKKLYRDGNYRMSIMIGCGCFFGLHISDILSLRWAQLINSTQFLITEKRTGILREIRINKNFQKHLIDCHNSLNIVDDSKYCFLNQYGSVMSIPCVNKALKEINVKYKLNIEHFSSNSLRIIFGRKVVHNAGRQSEMALIILKELFNRSSVASTRKYLGL